jgi:hypothetical protein
VILSWLFGGNYDYMHGRGEFGKQNYCLPIELNQDFLIFPHISSSSDRVCACKILLVTFIKIILHVYTWKPESQDEYMDITKNVYSLWDSGEKNIFRESMKVDVR